MKAEATEEETADMFYEELKIAEGRRSQMTDEFRHKLIVWMNHVRAEAYRRGVKAGRSEKKGGRG